MNRVLALKPSRTRSQTEVATKDGPEVIANLVFVDAEPVTEVVSHKARDPGSLEYIKCILYFNLVMYQCKKLLILSTIFKFKLFTLTLIALV